MQTMVATPSSKVRRVSSKTQPAPVFVENTSTVSITKDNDPNGTPMLAFEGKKGEFVKINANFMYRGGGVYYGIQSQNATPVSFSSGIVQDAPGWQACFMSQYYRLNSTGRAQFQVVFQYGDLPGEGQVNNFLLSRERIRISGVAHPGGPRWDRLADFPGIDGKGRWGAVAFGIGDKGYLGTGNDGADRNDFWEYNPSASKDPWTRKRDFPGSPRQYAVGFAIKGKGYVGTGSGTNDFCEYDPNRDAWTPISPLPGVPRSNAVGFSIGNKGYVGTGGPGLSDFYEYDPAKGEWTRKQDLPVMKRSAVGFSIGSKGYVGSGMDNTLRNPGADFYEYDPVSDTWTRKRDFLGGGMMWGTGFGTATKGYVVEPASGGFYEYDPAIDTWTLKPGPEGAKNRNSAVSFSIAGAGYYGTGYDYTNLSDFWKYSP